MTGYVPVDGTATRGEMLFEMAGPLKVVHPTVLGQQLVRAPVLVRQHYRAIDAATNWGSRSHPYLNARDDQ